ncbi:MAG: GNAT family N-acetyltransferase [Rhizobiaceae bacterium]|nr:GNAT family N-acetyltransferase [Rhizobiaceae bacterium]
MQITSDLDCLDFEATHALLKATYWGSQRTAELDRRAFGHSVCVIAMEDGQQVGFARAHGDQTLFARISDVIVWPEHRGQGIGKALVEALLGHPELRTVQTWMLNTADAQGLYKRYGFRPCTDGHEMRLDRST